MVADAPGEIETLASNLLIPKATPLKKKGAIMIDFIIAAALYLVLMFVVFSCLSFVTIGIMYALAGFAKRCMHGFRSPDLVLK
jgi:hypothetical protein